MDGFTVFAICLFAVLTYFLWSEYSQKSAHNQHKLSNEKVLREFEKIRLYRTHHIFDYQNLIDLGLLDRPLYVAPNKHKKKYHPRSK